MDHRGDGGMHPAAQAAQPAIQRIGALDDELTVLLRRWSGDSLACDYRARQRRHSEREPQAAVSQGHGVSGHKCLRTCGLGSRSAGPRDTGGRCRDGLASRPACEPAGVHHSHSGDGGRPSANVPERGMTRLRAVTGSSRRPSTRRNLHVEDPTERDLRLRSFWALCKRLEPGLANVDRVLFHRVTLATDPELHRHNPLRRELLAELKVDGMAARPVGPRPSYS